MNIRTPLYLLIALLALAGCSTTKDIAYLRTMEHTVAYARQQMQDMRIKPKDLLTITIQASQPELVAAFNGIYWTPNQQYQQSTYGIRTYLVDNEGLVDLPILGKVKLGAYTLREAEEVVRQALSPYLSEVPSVNIQVKNFRYSVIGEVVRPGAFVADNGKVNIFEALAQAGDMTIYGIRDDVKLIRELTDGSQQVISLNLQDPQLLSSPYYYLQQGDVLYVLPNNAKASSRNISSGTTIWVSIVSVALTVANLMITVLKR